MMKEGKKNYLEAAESCDTVLHVPTGTWEACE